ncbi:hypothetical protein C2G38_2217362 [Gigaspora rosea]|uniref:Uncharacterized protein n=1 Tax=Gigaspora rosea TaxID=44941 RepID=A0A397U844_9GLOM|nr:hypothetical protein C2G38_2217362 [Gigaspora rosea]
MRNMRSTNNLLHKMLKVRSAETVEEAEVFQKKMSKEKMSDTEYYKENEELTHSPIEQEKLQEVLIQLAWELWQEVT